MPLYEIKFWCLYYVLLEHTLAPLIGPVASPKGPIVRLRCALLGKTLCTVETYSKRGVSPSNGVNDTRYRLTPPHLTFPRRCTIEQKVFQEEEHPPFVDIKGSCHDSTLRKTGISV